MKWSAILAWSIEIDRAAKKDLEKLDKQVAKRIIKFLRERVSFLEDPRSIGEALKGSKLGDFWKYRVGDYRIISLIENKTFKVLVIKIGNRRDVYRKTNWWNNIKNTTIAHQPHCKQCCVLGAKNNKKLVMLENVNFSVTYVLLLVFTLKAMYCKGFVLPSSLSLLKTFNREKGHIKPNAPKWLLRAFQSHEVPYLKKDLKLI